MVRSSESGVDGWAEVVVAVTANPKAKAKAKAAGAKAKAKMAGAGGPPNVEKSLRSLIAADYAQNNDMTRVAKDIEANPTKWSLARDFLQRLAELGRQKQDVKESNDGFMSHLQAAVVCPTAMRELRKKIGLEYNTMLIRSLDAYKPLVDSFGEIFGKLQRMSEVENNLPSTPKSKGGGKKRKVTG